MTTKELRIGNMLTDGKFLFTIDCIEEDTIWSYIFHCVKPEKLEDYYIGGDYHFDIDNVEGIPLTEEWLLKFGFEGKINEISQCGNFYLGYDAEYGRHKMALWYQKGSWCFSHTNTFTVLKYVHQLQNLYFALTGEELIVSS